MSQHDGRSCKPLFGRTQSFGNWIRLLRAAARMDQELSTAAGIGQVTLVRFESVEQSPRYVTLVAQAGAARSVGS